MSSSMLGCPGGPSQHGEVYIVSMVSTHFCFGVSITDQQASETEKQEMGTLETGGFYESRVSRVYIERWCLWE